MPSHVPMWGCAVPQNRLGNSTNDVPGKSQRAAITCSFVDIPLLHRARVWFLSGRPSFSFSLAHTLTSLPSLAHFAVCITYFLSCFLSISLLACLSVSFRSSRASPASLPHTSSSSSSRFTSKFVIVGCVSRRNASSDCIFHPQCNNEAGVLLPPPFSSPSSFPFVPHKWGFTGVNTISRKAKRNREGEKRLAWLFNVFWHLGKARENGVNAFFFKKKKKKDASQLSPPATNNICCLLYRKKYKCK